MKPRLSINGQDGNIFAVMGAASKVLKRAGLSEQAKEMVSRVTSCKSYNEALAIISDYVDWEL
jgi:hypothetical protein